MNSNANHFWARVLRRETLAGLFMAVIGIAVALGSHELRIGTPARMGPGFLPLVLGLLLIASGLAITISGARDATPIPSVPTWRPLIALSIGFVLFAVLIGSAGLSAAAFAAVIAASLAMPVSRWGEMLIYAAALTAFVAVLFIELLDLPLKVWP